MSESTLTEKSHVKHDEEYMEHRRATIRKSQQKRRMKAKESGMCGVCCKRPVKDGYKTCEMCIMRAIDWNKRNRNDG
jgi:hypothetical protein